MFPHTEAHVASAWRASLEISRALNVMLNFKNADVKNKEKKRELNVKYQNLTLRAVSVEGVRSAEPPINSGTASAIAFSTSSERFRVAAALVSYTSRQSNYKINNEKKKKKR